MMAFMLPLGLIAGGTLLTYVYEDHAPVMVRFCGGACIGFAFFGLAGFVFASLFGFNLIAVALTLLTAASPSLLLATRQNATRMYSDIQATVRNMRGAIVHPNTLDAYIARLRRKLRALPGAPRITTVRGVGYSVR